METSLKLMKNVSSKSFLSHYQVKYKEGTYNSFEEFFHKKLIESEVITEEDYYFVKQEYNK